MNVEQWDYHEIVLIGPTEGNPFLDVSLTARFTCGGQAVELDGFYDGDGTYRVRFMPNRTGAWSWQTISNEARLHGRIGEFTCVQPGHILDVWNMTVSQVPEMFTLVVSDDGARAEGQAAVPLPDAPYIALRLRRVEGPVV